MVSSNGVGRANVRRAYDNEEVGDVGGAGAGRRRPQARDPSLGVRSFGAPSQDPLSVRLLPSGEFVAISPVSRENIAYFLFFSRLYYLFFLNVFFFTHFVPFFYSAGKSGLRIYMHFGTRYFEYIASCVVGRVKHGWLDMLTRSRGQLRVLFGGGAHC